MIGVRIAPGAIVALAALAGCTGSPPPKADPNDLAKAKVEAMKNLAEVLKRDPNGPDVFEALEGFRNVSIDPAKYPDVAREVLAIYKQEIEGKYKGENAQQVHIEVMAFCNQAKSK
jgi:hypothetical protein